MDLGSGECLPGLRRGSRELGHARRGLREAARRGRVERRECGEHDGEARAVTRQGRRGDRDAARDAPVRGHDDGRPDRAQGWRADAPARRAAEGQAHDRGRRDRYGGSRGARARAVLDRSREVRLARRADLHGDDGQVPERRSVERCAAKRGRGARRGLSRRRSPRRDGGDRRRHVRRARRARAVAVAVRRERDEGARRRRARRHRVPRLLADEGARRRSAARHPGRSRRDGHRRAQKRASAC